MSRVRDIVSNIQVSYTTNFFTGDTTDPTSKATFPTGEVSEVLLIQGTAQDTLPGELRNGNMVEISIKGVGNICYEDASKSFIGCPTDAYPGDRIWFTTGTVDNTQGQPGNWTWNTSAISWVNETQYQVHARAFDKAGNQAALAGSESPDITFTVKTPQADTTISQPVGVPDTNYKASNVSNISGVGANLRAVNSLEIHIKRLKEPTSWWYEPDQAWVNVDTFTFVNHVAGSWSQSLIDPGLAFSVDNASYTITSIGYNSSNEAESPPTQKRIIIDNTLPLGLIQSPNQTYVNNLDNISGTAFDPNREDLPELVREGMSKVYVMVKDINGGTYWDGTGFNAFGPSSEMLTSGTLNWSTATLLTPALQDGKNYSVFAKPVDKANNKDDNEFNSNLRRSQ
jgi:hypothetical protein